MLTQSSINAHFEGRMKSSTVTQLDTSSFSESFSKKDKNINENLISKLAYTLLELITFRSQITGYCYTRVKTFSEYYHHSVSTIQRALNELVDRKLIYRVRDGNCWVSMLPLAYENRDVLFALNRPRDIGKIYYSIKPYTAPDLKKVLGSKLVVGKPVYFGQFYTPVDRCDELRFDACLPIHTKDMELEKRKKQVVQSAASRQPVTTPIFKNKNSHKQAKPIVQRKVITDQELECLYRCYSTHKEEVDRRLKNARNVLSMIENDCHTSTSSVYALGEYGLAKKYLEEWKARVEEKEAKQRKNTMTELSLEKTPESERIDFARKFIEDRPWLDRYLRVDINAVYLILPHLRPIIATLPTYSISSCDPRFKERLEDIVQRIEDFHFEKVADSRLTDLWQSQKTSGPETVIRYSYKK